MIGDKLSDIKLAVNAGIKNTILINSIYTNNQEKNLSNFVVDSLNETINIVKE